MIYDTILSKMVKDFGDIVMVAITQDLYGSGIAKLIVFVFGTAAFLNIAYCLHKKEPPVKAIMFFVAWICCLPIQGKPLAYVMVNGLGTSLAHQLQKTGLKILGYKKNKMPPGWIMNAILRAASTEITDKRLQEDILLLMENCIPSGIQNYKGEPLTVNDLFSYKTNGRNTEGNEETFEIGLLNNRQSGRFAKDSSSVSCYRLLKYTRGSLKRHLKTKNLTQMPGKNYKDVSSGEINAGEIKHERASQNQWINPRTPEAESIKKASLNLAIASTIQKEAIKAYIPDSVLSSLRETIAKNGLIDKTVLSNVAASGSSLTGIAFDIMSIPKAITRTLGIDKALANAAVLHEIDERLRSLPYTVAFVQSILKMLAPIAVLSILCATYKIFSAWIFLWLSTLLVPVIMHLTRAISNSILLHTNKLTESITALQHEPAFLTLGVNFDAANALIEDSTRMINSILTVEMGIWVSLTVIMMSFSPMASKFMGGATMGGASMLSKMHNGLFIARSAKFAASQAASGTKMIVSKAKPLASAAASFVISKNPAAFVRYFSKRG